MKTPPRLLARAFTVTFATVAGSLGLRADDIPLDARIVHVADAFDAMTSARAYRAGLPASVAFAELERFSGTQFDPACVEALLAAMPSSHDIAEPALAQLLGRQVV